MSDLLLSSRRTGRTRRLILAAVDAYLAGKSVTVYGANAHHCSTISFEIVQELARRGKGLSYTIRGNLSSPTLTDNEDPTHVLLVRRVRAVRVDELERDLDTTHRPEWVTMVDHFAVESIVPRLLGELFR